jgi:hypothetical protein
MYIYNVTINIDDSIHKPWLNWIDKHIKDVLATKRFISAKLTRVLVEEEMGGTTYSVQYTAKTRQDLDDYYKFDAEALRKDSDIFKGKFVAFRTELHVIKEY